MSAVDVIAVTRDQNNVRTSPFCILFKNRPKIKKPVSVFINNTLVDLPMWLLPNGNTVFTEDIISEEPVSPLVKKHEEKGWREKTIDWFSTREHYENQIPNETTFATLLKQHKIVNEMNIITFKTDEESIDATLYLWSIKEKIVIVDVDGTITKSDLGGQLYTMLGKDYTHVGAAKLFQQIVKNGYKLIYLTARPITQIHVTREYLWNIDQDNWKMPRMPVLTTPNSKMVSMIREVIVKIPHEFKIELLAYIAMMFPTSPFYAGFGNRHTDEISYDTHGIEKGKIFIINTRSIVRYGDREFENYLVLCESVPQLFPDLHDTLKDE